MENVDEPSNQTASHHPAARLQQARSCELARQDFNFA